MSKFLIGLLFILAGVCYGSFAIDDIYNHTLGYLVANKWITPPKQGNLEKNILGRKSTILFYAAGLIIIGLFLLWNFSS